MDDYDIKPEPVPAAAPAPDHPNDALPAPEQPQAAVPSMQQIPIAPGGLSIQPLDAHMAVDTMPEAAGPDYRSQVMMHAPLQPHSVPLLPPILAAAVNAALQPGSGSMQSLLHGEEPQTSEQMPHLPPNP